jgi:mannose-1-phosphate guanylyltransferase
MVIVIIAGGSGTRLWPLSQPNYPKHLLRLTGDNSLLQNTYERARQSTDKIYIVTEASHAGEVRDQLPELDPTHVLVEPGRRGTASCILLALATVNRDYPGETVVFLHADHHIVDAAGFTATVQAAATAAADEQRIALIGLTPTHPATGFGYIQAGPEIRQIDGLSVRRAEKFVEKPHFELAQEYVDSGDYLWNLGLFAAPVEVFVTEMSDYAPELHQGYLDLSAALGSDALDETYLNLKSEPIDTALMEKVSELLVVPGKFDWADVGSFFDLHNILQSADTNSLQGDIYQVDCTDSMVHGSSKPIVAIGLEGIIVVDTPEGLLVCAKDQSQKVGDLVKVLQAKQAQK